MTRKQIIAKIRKCLALAKSANEHEAAAALDKARELMEAYAIGDPDIQLAEVEEATARGTRAQRPPLWENVLNAAVCRALSVTSFVDRNCDRKFLGRGAEAEIAAYAFHVLFRHLQRARREFIATTLKRCKPARKRARADMFCEGWVGAVYRSVKALSPERADDPLIQQYLAVRYPGLTTIVARDAKAGRSASNDWSAGFQRGSTVDLNRGVGGSGPQGLLA